MQTPDHVAADRLPDDLGGVDPLLVFDAATDAAEPSCQERSVNITIDDCYKFRTLDFGFVYLISKKRGGVLGRQGIRAHDQCDVS